MLDFNKLDGFYVDLSTHTSTLKELEKIMECKEDRNILLHDSGIEGVRHYIMNYYLSSYDKIFMKEQNFYFICESNLTQTYFITNYYEKLLTEHQNLLKKYFSKGNVLKTDEQINNINQRITAVENLLREIGLITF